MKPQPLSVTQIRQFETKAQLKGLPLMARAGLCAARFALAHSRPLKRVLILAGPGHNGGDALITASHLFSANVEVLVVMPASPSPQAQEARDALMHWKSLGGPTTTEWSQSTLDTGFDLIIDGLFGIGLNKPLSNPWQHLIDRANSSQVPILALDIPSGLLADSGEFLGRPVCARWTVAFIAPSHALYDEKSRKFVGEWHVCTLGLEV